MWADNVHFLSATMNVTFYRTVGLMPRHFFISKTKTVADVWLTHDLFMFRILKLSRVWNGRHHTLYLIADWHLCQIRFLV